MATVIFNSDNSVQGTITSITSTPLGINIYAYNTNLSSLSSYSTLSINNLNATSTTIFNNLNSLSTNSILSINNLNATSTTIFNNLNSLSTNSMLSINNLNATSTTLFTNLNSISTNSMLNINNLKATSTTIFTNLNSLSTNSILSINNLNSTSSTIFNNLNSLSTNSILSINNLNATSTTIFNNLNSLSTNSILSINNLNATSTTLFTNLNSISTNSMLNINNLKATSTTIFTNLNSLSTNSILSINNLNATSTTIFNNLNSLSTNSMLNISNLQATSTTIFNKTNFSNLIVSNASTLLSSLNIVGNIIGSGTALTNLNYNSILNPPSLVSFNNPSTLVSSLNVSGFTTLSNNTTLVSSLNVSGNTTLNNITTINSSLTVSGNTTLNNITTINSSLTVSGNATLNNATTINSTLNVSGNTTLSNTTTIFGILTVSGNTTLNNITTCRSSLNVSGNTTLNNATTINSSLNLSGNIIMGTNNSYPDLRLGSTDGNNLGIATANGGFSTSALAGDMIFRSINRLLLQNGAGSAGIIINNNKVGIGTITPTNILQVGDGARLRISNGSSDYTLIGTKDVDDATNTRIVISGNTRAAPYSGNIDYVATSGNHIFYTSGTEKMRLDNNGTLNVSGLSLLNRIATYNNTLPNLTAVNNATTHSIISIFPGINTQQGVLQADLYNIYLSSFAYGTSLSGPQPYITVNCSTLYNGSNTKLTLQAYGNATGGSYGSKIIVNGGSAGGGNISFINDNTTTCVMNSSGLYVNGGILNLNAADYNIGGQRGIIFRSGFNTPNNNNYNCSILTYDHNGDTFPDGLSINGFDGISFCTGGNTRVERMRIDINGNVNINNNLTVNGKITLKNDLWHITNDNVNRFYFAANGTTFISGGGTSSSDNALIVYASGTFSYATILSILNNGNVGMGGINNSAYKLHVNGTTYFQGDSVVGANLQVNGNLQCGTCTPIMRSVQNSGTDYIGVQINTTQGSDYQYPLCIMWASFTGFHRCIIDDELFNNENPQQFKDDYVGRLVISSGKIATDTKQAPDDEWELKYDKEGITIEDALFMVQLTRKKKDKRVVGVLGMASRNNSRPERMIVNSVGEGGIWVINNNGTIENGDYITSSDYLGYGEKQDDDLLHNYTAAKATIDCNFELDSPYYNCLELEGTNYRIAFIACTYHCG